LRFTNLNTTLPATSNPGLGILSVNASGDIIYVHTNTGSGGSFVNCANTGPASNLTADSKVSLNNKNLYFATNDILGKNHVGIGYDCTPALPAKLSVIQTHPAFANSNTTAISGFNNDKSNDFYHTFVGAHGKAFGEQINVPKAQRANLQTKPSLPLKSSPFL